MPRNGSGVFTLAGADFPAVALTVIDPVKHNNNFTDVATAITASIAVDGQSVITADIPMFGKKFTGVGDGSLRTHSASIGQVQDDRLNWVIATGTANAITAIFAPAITALVDGQTVRVRAIAANTGAATFSPNGLTARPITDWGGTPITAGIINGAGQELVLVYNSTALRWELANPALGSLVKVGTEALPAWPATWRVVDLGERGAVFQQATGEVGFVQNAYHDGANWRTRVTGAASVLQLQTDGSESYFSAPSVAANAILTFTLARSTSVAGVLTLGAAGNAVRHNGNTFHGRVDPAGAALRLPAGWSSVKAATGLYTYTHNLNSTAHTIIPATEDNFAVARAQMINKGLNSFQISTTSGTSAAATDMINTFIMILD